MAISKDDLRRLEELLLRDRERTMRKLARFAAEFVDAGGEGAPGDRNPFTLHAAEQGTDAMEREKAFLLAGEEGRRLAAIDEALRRLYATPDAFGRCEGCGQEIGLARLEAVPHATLCISCQVLREGGGG